jgi:hypothetical protein
MDKVFTAGIIAQPFPKFENPVLPGRGQISDPRKCLNKPFVISKPLFDPGLLENDLAEPDPVRVTYAFPGHLPGVFPGVPFQEGLPEKPGFH